MVYYEIILKTISNKKQKGGVSLWIIKNVRRKSI